MPGLHSMYSCLIAISQYISWKVKIFTGIYSYIEGTHKEDILKSLLFGRVLIEGCNKTNTKTQDCTPQIGARSFLICLFFAFLLYAFLYWKCQLLLPFSSSLVSLQSHSQKSANNVNNSIGSKTDSSICEGKYLVL